MFTGVFMDGRAPTLVPEQVGSGRSTMEIFPAYGIRGYSGPCYPSLKDTDTVDFLILIKLP